MGVKQILLIIAVVIGQSVLPADKKPLIADPIVEKAVRSPFSLNKPKGELTWRRPPGGLVSALDPVMQAIKGGLWVAQGIGEGDRISVDPSGRVPVPPDDPMYTLKRIWLEQAEIEGFYEGFANEGLWPLCHVVFHRPRFNASDWEYYQKVNQRFAHAILEEIENVVFSRPTLLVGLALKVAGNPGFSSSIVIIPSCIS